MWNGFFFGATVDQFGSKMEYAHKSAGMFGVIEPVEFRAYWSSLSNASVAGEEVVVFAGNPDPSPFLATAGTRGKCSTKRFNRDSHHITLQSSLGTTTAGRGIVLMSNKGQCLTLLKRPETTSAGCFR